MFKLSKMDWLALFYQGLKFVLAFLLNMVLEHPGVNKTYAILRIIKSIIEIALRDVSLEEILE